MIFRFFASLCFAQNDEKTAKDSLLSNENEDMAVICHCETTKWSKQSSEFKHCLILKQSYLLKRIAI